MYGEDAHLEMAYEDRYYIPDEPDENYDLYYEYDEEPDPPSEWEAERAADQEEAFQDRNWGRNT